MRAPVVILVLSTLAACGDNVHTGDVAIATPPAWTFAIGELARLTPGATLALGIDPDADFQLTLVDDAAIPVEGFRIDQSTSTAWAIHAHDVLGAQYGTSAALENLGIRFRHPYDPEVPAHLAFAPTTPLAFVQAPEVRVRGLQLHTLHPIESYFAFWEPSPGSKNDAHRVIDWVIKNRGNFLQWVALDDIMQDDRHAGWATYTRELIDYAHARGIRVGLNIQLFGQSNLQLAFDLSDAKPADDIPIADEIAARLPLVVRDTPFDVYALSFGEFFNADPQKFIDAVDEVQRQLAVLAPAAEMHAVVHVGAEQRVTFMGEDLLYYFLVKFASPAIVPDIHTVMFYDLFEDAGLAYHHEDFAEHRAYLEERMCAKRRAAYFPETAYWVAFDNSVPQWDPLYLRSRLYDLQQLKARPCWPLDEQLLFSSGWEWGYWMNDAFALRASYTVPGELEPLLATLAPTGTSAFIAEVAELQHTGLLVHRLAAYLAGRDVAIDSGDVANIVSQPDRVTFADLVASNPSPADLASFTSTIVDPLVAYADAFAAITPPTATDPATDRWTRELADGFAVDRLRAAFVVATYRAVVAHLGGDAATASARYDEAQARLTEAHAIVQRRHAELHDAAPAASGAAPDLRRRLLDPTGDKISNRTFYQYGYLNNADTLCFWQRELDQVGGILGNTTTAPLGCLINH
ncbi:MAG: hypothetical protein NT062_18580 [Proteobacteria bacterium]|nr:hypothetical protein [Pseudomonadota bacterium]